MKSKKHAQIFDEDVDDSSIDGEEANSWVYFLLSTTTRDAPLQILKEVKIGEGRLAIHALQNIYASKRPERVSALITEIFALQYTTLSNFRQNFNRLNSALKECSCEIPIQVLRHRILTSLPSQNTQQLYKNKSGEATSQSPSYLNNSQSPIVSMHH